MTRPTPGDIETRTAPDLLSTDERKIRGLVPYGIESRDLNGWREVIEPTALRGATFDDLVVTVDHAGVPLGRYPRRRLPPATKAGASTSRRGSRSRRSRSRGASTTSSRTAR